MLYLESFVNIKNGRREKIIYVKEDRFVALVRAEVEEPELTGFLYSILDELKEDMSLFDFDELIARKIHDHNLPPALDLACGYLINSKLLLKTVGKGKILGRRGREGGVIIFGNKSAVGKVEPNDLFIFSFEDFKEEKLFTIKKENFIHGENEDYSEAFILAFVENLEEKEEAGLKTKFPNISLSISSGQFQIILVGVLLVFLLGSVYIGYTRRQEKIAKARVQQVKQEVESLLGKAEEEAILSPSKAKDYFSQAEEKVKELENSLPKSKRAFVFEVKELLEKRKAEIFKEEKGNLKEFFDLRLLGKSLSGKKITYSQDKAFVLTESNEVVQINLETKASNILNLEDVGRGILISSFDGEVYVLTDKGIYKIKENPELLVEKSEFWESLVDFEVYGKNFYVLDKEKNQVFKFTPVEEGYSNAIEYLKPPLPAVIENSDMAIDGSIYIASRNTLYKYFQGKKTTFSLKLPVEEYFIDFVYTNKDIDNLYLLDKKAKKIYIINKENGNLNEQVFNPVISKTQGFFVADSKIYILVGDKIYLLR